MLFLFKIFLVFLLAFFATFRTSGYRRRYFHSEKKIKARFYFAFHSFIRTFATK